MLNSNPQHRSYFFVRNLLIGLLLATWLAPAARGDGWPYWPFNKEEKPGKPDKITALWSDTVLTQTGQPPIRGFGGRLMFYEGQKEEPIKVEGTLVVYAFDETDRDANNSRPDRKYAFTPQQLPAHYSKSKIGHSYSVWLPWDEVGGMQKEITLIVRFQPKEGPAAVSDPCRELLPGQIPPIRPTATTTPINQLGTLRSQGNEGVQPASYQTPETEGTGLFAEWQRRRLATTTISVPSGSAIRAAISTPQVLPAGYYQPAPGQASPTPAPANYPPRNYSPQGYFPTPAPSLVSRGPQPQSGFAPARPWAQGEPPARLDRDRAPWAQHPAGSPSAPASEPGQGPANAGPALQPSGPQSPN
jgi:hypothetical protein